MRNQTTRLYIFGATIVATLGGLLFGYDTGVIAGSQLYFTEYFQLTDAEQGWAVSSALYGCLAGAILAGRLTSSLGRKYSLILAGFLFVVSAWGSGMPESLTTLIVFRIIGGIGVGIASMTSPMYIAELAPPNERGSLVTFYQLAVVVGFFLVFLATYTIGGGDVSGVSAEEVARLHRYNVERGWRMMFWSELIPAGIFFFLSFFIPHSPRWLMLKGRDDEAKQVLQRVAMSEEVAERECREIKQAITAENGQAKSSLFSRAILAALCVGVGVSILQQVTGINAILYYGAEIFSSSLGYGPEDALKQQLLLGFVNLVCTFVAVYQIDRWGRKPLLICGAMGMFVGVSVFAWTLYYQQVGLVSLIAVLLYVGAFALSLGPVTWVLLSEIFPARVRSAAMSVAVAAQWIFNALVSGFFPVLNGSEINQSLFNGALPYLIFAAFCLLTVIFGWRAVPETKGKSLEELEAVWR